MLSLVLSWDPLQLVPCCAKYPPIRSHHASLPYESEAVKCAEVLVKVIASEIREVISYLAITLLCTYKLNLCTCCIIKPTSNHSVSLPSSGNVSITATHLVNLALALIITVASRDLYQSQLYQNWNASVTAMSMGLGVLCWDTE